MPAASFQPETIDLSSGAVQLIRTALGNPKVTFDGTGIKAYDANGNVILNMDAINGRIIFKAALGSTIDAADILGQLTDSQLSAITAAKITGQLTSAQIASVAAAAVTGQLTAAQIASVAAATITGTIGTTQIAAGAITTPLIAANAITAGLIAAGAIDGKTITGAILQTAATGARVVLDASGLKSYNSAGTVTNEIDSADGSATFRQITAQGMNVPAASVVEGDLSNLASQITWKRASDGALVASIQGSINPGGLLDSYLLLHAKNPAANLAGVDAFVENSGTSKIVRMIDTSGNSTFPQLPSAKNLKISAGVITSAAGVSFAGTGDWTASRSSAGVYVISFPAKGSATPIALATPVWNTNGSTVRIEAWTSTTVTFQVLNTANAAEDNGIAFAIIG